MRTNTHTGTIKKVNSYGTFSFLVIGLRVKSKVADA